MERASGTNGAARERRRRPASLYYRASLSKISWLAMADRRSTFLRELGHPRSCIGVCRVHTWLFCALCIASIHYLSAFSHFIPLNGDAFRLIVILCLFRERTVNICFLVCNIDSFQFQNSILLTELLLFSCDNSCLEFSWIQENSIERLL